MDSPETWEEVKVKKPKKLDDFNYIEIEVTAEHILRAVQLYAEDQKSRWDPIAIAIKIQLKCSFVAVGWGYATSYLSGTKTQWTLEPFKEIRDFLKEWDKEHYGVLPISIRMYKEKDVEGPSALKRAKGRQRNFYDNEAKQGKLKL